MHKAVPTGLRDAGGHPRAMHPVRPLPCGQAICKQTDADMGPWVILPLASSSCAHVSPADISPHRFNTSTHPFGAPKAERQGSKPRQTGQPHAPYSRFALQKKRATFSSSLFSRKNAAPSPGAPSLAPWRRLKGGLGSQAGPTAPLNQPGHA